MEDDAEAIEHIHWSAAGKIREIIRTAVSEKPDLEFRYDAQGNRVCKIEKTKEENGDLLPEEDWIYTYYRVDATGNVIAVYRREREVNESGPYDLTDHFTLKELNIYGSSRLGMYHLDATRSIRYDNDVQEEVYHYAHHHDNSGSPYSSTRTVDLVGITNVEELLDPEPEPGDVPMAWSARITGMVQYEIANHLGNVQAVINDKKLAVEDEDLVTYHSGLIFATDYYPFGMTMPERALNTPDYRYGFNGQEKDDEVSGSGNSYDFGARMYDGRLGRWWSVDPKYEKYPYSSTYSSFINNPLLFIDPEGDTIRVGGTIDEQWITVGFLQTLTNDKISMKNGVVYIEKMGGANTDQDYSVGTSLIRDLLKHKKDVYIQQNYINVNTASVWGFGEIKNAFNGVGLDAKVNIDLTKESKHLTEDMRTKKTKWEVSPREIKLAHELIHAYYIMNGMSIKNDAKGTAYYDYIDEKGTEVRAYDWKEETETVGITGSRKYTENKIRKEHGKGNRVKY